MASIKLKTSFKNGVATIKMLIAHPMESGFRKDSKTGKVIPAEYITNVTCTIHDEVVMETEWGGFISKNPYLSCKARGFALGDKVVVTWVDNKKNTDRVEGMISS